MRTRELGEFMVTIEQVNRTREDALARGLAGWHSMPEVTVTLMPAPRGDGMPTARVLVQELYPGEIVIEEVGRLLAQIKAGQVAIGRETLTLFSDLADLVRLMGFHEPLQVLIHPVERLEEPALPTEDQVIVRGLMRRQEEPDAAAA